MRRSDIAVLVVLLVAARVWAQGAPPERMEAWQYFAEVKLPSAGEAKYFDFLLTPAVFDRARADLTELRLYDGRGREVPYAVRVRRAVDERMDLFAREFNRARTSDAAELSLDLASGPQAPEFPSSHNEIEVASPGTDFRRRLVIEGNDGGDAWHTLLDRAYIVHFAVEGQVVDVRRFSYPESHYRRLRLRVYRDAGNPDDRPEITAVRVYRSRRVPGEDVTVEAAAVGGREAVPGDGGPGSAWEIRFGAGEAGEATPCGRLNVDVAEDEFTRPYRLETFEPGVPAQILTAGVWQRRKTGPPGPLEIRLNQEVFVRRLRLTVTDFRNPPLHVTAVSATAPARELVFARAPEPAAPLRLYFGNPARDEAPRTASYGGPVLKKGAPAPFGQGGRDYGPRYDFAATLPARLDPAPARATLGGAEPNPAYRPAPKPWSERWPWLVYVFLGGASLALLGILGLLAREAVARADATLPDDR